MMFKKYFIGFALSLSVFLIPSASYKDGIVVYQKAIYEMSFAKDMQEYFKGNMDELYKKREQELKKLYESKISDSQKAIKQRVIMEKYSSLALIVSTKQKLTLDKLGKRVERAMQVLLKRKKRKYIALVVPNGKEAIKVVTSENHRNFKDVTIMLNADLNKSSAKSFIPSKREVQKFMEEYNRSNR